MLVVRPKIADLDFKLFGRSIHPELFNSCSGRKVQREHYSLELNITSDGHLILFRHNDLTLAEISSSSHHPLPTGCLLMSHAMQGERQDKVSCNGNVDYECQFQLDHATPKTVLAIQQQLSPEVECEGLVHRFAASGRMAFGAISYINVQSFCKHVQIRTFHTFPDTCSIVKSCSLFTIRD